LRAGSGKHSAPGGREAECESSRRSFRNRSRVGGNPWGSRLVGSQRPACLLDSLEVTGLPALLNRGLGRAIKSDYRKVTLAGNGRQPIGTFTLGRLGTKVEVRTAVVVLCRLVSRSKRRKWLAIGEPRSICSLIA
jgi:hypothetical protein